MFYKDIWSLIFEKLESNLEIGTLDSLSLTCKKLYNLDKERQRNYQKQLKENFLIASVLTPYLKRRAYLCIVKYIDIALLDISTYKKSHRVENTFLFIFPQLFVYLDLCNIKTCEDLKNAKDFDKLALKQDIDLVCMQTNATELVSAFFLSKHDGDLVCSIMEYTDRHICSFLI